MRIASLAIAASVALGWTGCASAQPARLEVRESQYNTIYISRNGNYVSMQFGQNERLFTESIANVTDPLELPAEYARYMTLAMAYVPDARRILEVGLGGGVTSAYLRSTFPDLDITIVELDPAVVELAEQYFFLRQDDRLRVEVRDGRIFLVRSDERYDFILIDAFRAPFTPFHLQTREFFQLVANHLTEGGVMAQNVVPYTMLYEPSIATMQAVFDHVDLYVTDALNYVVVAYDGPERTMDQLGAGAVRVDVEHGPRYPMAGLLVRRQPLPPFQAQILTDDFAPVELLDTIERNNDALRPN